MPRRVLTTAFLTELLAGVAALSATSASADTLSQTGASTDDGGITVHAGVAALTAPLPGSVGSGDGSAPPCSYEPVDPSFTILLSSSERGRGTWLAPVCEGIMWTGGVIWLPVGTAPAVPPLVVARDAVARLQWPSPMIEMSPSTDTDQIVGAPTFLWVDPTVWRTFTATASVDVVAATATATPAKVVWNLGDGDQVTCSGPGTPYDFSRADSAQDMRCVYTWPHSSYGQPGHEYTVTATVYYRVRWTSVGAPGGGDFGILPGPRASAAVRVAEIQVLNGQ